MRKIIFLILCLLWMGSIYYMSSVDGAISHKDSYNLVSIIKNIMKSTSIPVNISVNYNNQGVRQNKVAINKADFIVRKSAHFGEFLILAILACSTAFEFKLKGKAAVIYILFFCLLYAVLDEFHQMFTDDRTSSVADVLIDFSGSCIGIGLYYFIYYMVLKRLRIFRKRYI